MVIASHIHDAVNEFLRKIHKATVNLVGPGGDGSLRWPYVFPSEEADLSAKCPN